MKKKIITLFMAAVMLGSCVAGMLLPLSGATVNEEREVSDMETNVYVLSDVRNRISFNEGWKFIKESASGAEQPKFDDSAWADVSLPHSWNDDDYNADKYYQNEAWYRKTFEADTREEYKKNNTRLWVEFEACGKYAQVYINGTLLGNHVGGYSAFRYDITNYLSDTGTNVIAVMGNNGGRGQTISPLGMDFTIWGGLYRDAWLIETSSVGVDMSDNGSSGFFLSAQKEEDSDNWSFNVSSKIVNATSKKVTAEAEIILRHPKRSDLTWMDETYDLTGTSAIAIGSDENPFLFDPDKMYKTFENEDDYVVEKRTIPLTISANGSVDVSEDFTVENPELWNGVYSPYRYVAEINIKVGGETVDHVKDFFGFRYYRIDAETGFYLNGEPYELKGINKHQDFGGLDENGKFVGTCTTGRERYIDMCLLYEMGANYFRLVHYPHEKAFYDLCDAYGICVSAELALGGHIGGKSTFDQKDSATRKFFDGMESQLTELVKQQHNNPSIIIWGLSNEINVKYFETMKHYHAVLNDLAHELDGNNRYTSYTICADGQVGLAADLIAWNMYPMNNITDQEHGGDLSYTTYKEKFAKIHDDFLNDPRYEQYIAMSLTETGAVSHPFHHSDVIAKPEKKPGSFYPEEWSNYVNEGALRAYEEVDYLWVLAPWQYANHASTARDEADQKGISHAGLLTYDRKVKKDVYYLYKANYSEVPFVYFAENRFTPRDKNEISVKCYSNADSVSLYKMMDGEKTFICDMKSQGAGIFLSPALPLYFGDNEYIAEITENGKTYTMTCTFASTSDVAPTLPDIPVTDPDDAETSAPDTGIDSPVDESGAYRVTEKGASINAAEYATWKENNLEAAEYAASVSVMSFTLDESIISNIRYGDVITFKINVDKAGTYNLSYAFVGLEENSFSVSIDGGEAFTLTSDLLSPNPSIAVDSKFAPYDFTSGEHTVELTFSKEDGGCDLFRLDFEFVKAIEEESETSTAVEETTVTPTETATEETETTVVPADDATDAPAGEAPAGETTAAEASGCKSAIGAAAATAALITAAGAVALKKKED